VPSYGTLSNNGSQASPHIYARKNEKTKSLKATNIIINQIIEDTENTLQQHPIKIDQ